MGEPIVPGERRGSLRVPVRGVALLYASGGPLHGMVENLSQTGALVSVASRIAEEHLDMEIRLAEGSGWVVARIVRVEPHARQWRIAVAFDRVDDSLRDAIEASINAARGAARRRPILVIDENSDRKRDLIARLANEGMTPLAPKTPLEAIDLLTRSQLHVGVCLLAPGFGVPSNDLRAVLTDSFPWVSVAEITDDLDATTHHAINTWYATPIARIGDALV
ncbi:MAG TPA: PilZ domain-containing protein [Kofleriaceae bacterium]